MEHTPAPINLQATVLIADDDELILRSVSAILAASNYKVLVANSGVLALQQSKEYEGSIDLLLSDFEMPGMTGVDLATKITADRPKIKVLLMSGFSAGMLVLNEGWHFLPKPFIASQLRTLVQGLLMPETVSKFKAASSQSEVRAIFLASMLVAVGI